MFQRGSSSSWWGTHDIQMQTDDTTPAQRKQRKNRKWGHATHTSPSALLLSARLHILKVSYLPKPCYQLSTECSNPQGYGRHFISKQQHRGMKVRQNSLFLWAEADEVEGERILPFITQQCTA